MEDQRERDIGGEQEGVGASGSLRSLVIFITRKRLTLLFVPPSISPTNLWSIFKLTGHSNKFSLFSRHYKYNLEREYSRSRILLIVSLVLFFVLSAMKENFGRKTRRFLSLSLSIISRSISFSSSDINRTWNKHRRDSRFVSISFPSILPEKCIFQLHFLSTSPAY